MAQAKNIVCINVSITMDTFEMVQVNTAEGNIEKAGFLPAPFDLQNRTIPDEEEMTLVIKDLYETSKVSLSTPTILILPSYFTREIDLPEDIDDAEVEVTLTSEAERFIVFKKTEPHVGWTKATDTHYLYAAFPKPEIDKLGRIFQKLKIPLQIIELNYLCILRGLLASGVIADEVNQQKRWCLVVIGENILFSALFEGLSTYRTLEVPLSSGEDTDKQKLSEIEEDFGDFIASEDLDKLVLINNTHNLNSDWMVDSLRFNGEIIAIEQNLNTLKSFGNEHGLFPCSLEALGASVREDYPEAPIMNFLPESTKTLFAVLSVRKYLNFGLILGNVSALLACIIMWGVFALITVLKEGEIRELANQITKATTAQMDSSIVHQRLFIKTRLDRNVLTNNLLIQMGATMPAQAWLTEATIDNTGSSQEQSVNVIGGALIPEIISDFLTRLQKELKRDNLEVSKIDLAKNADGQNYYSWTLQNKKKAP